jgi:hypothetical protein
MSWRAGSWVTRMSIDFTGSDGRVVRVQSNYVYWAEDGNGDFEVGPGFKEYVLSLVKNNHIQPSTAPGERKNVTAPDEERRTRG